MRRMVAILMTFFLVGCGTAELVSPSSLPANDATTENTQKQEQPENIIPIEQCTQIVPGETTHEELREILSESVHEDGGAIVGGGMLGYAITTAFATDHSNHILIRFYPYVDDVPVISYWHTIPNFDDWQKIKDVSKDSEELSENDNPTPYDIDDVYYISRQDSENANVASMEQFVHIIPGESSLLDICKIIEESDIGACSVDSATFGWRLKFPTDNPRTIIVVDMDSDYTVLRIGHTLKDVPGWLEAHGSIIGIWEGPREDSPTDIPQSPTRKTGDGLREP